MHWILSHLFRCFNYTGKYWTFVKGDLICRKSVETLIVKETQYLYRYDKLGCFDLILEHLFISALLNIQFEHLKDFSIKGIFCCTVSFVFLRVPNYRIPIFLIKFVWFFLLCEKNKRATPQRLQNKNMLKISVQIQISVCRKEFFIWKKRRKLAT